MKPEIQTTIHRLHISGHDDGLFTALKWQVYGELDATCKKADAALDLAIWKQIQSIISQYKNDKASAAAAVKEYFTSDTSAWVVEYKGKDYLNEKFASLWERRNELT